MSRRKTRVYLALAWHELGHMLGINRYACEANWTLHQFNTWSGSTDDLRRFRPHGIISQLFAGSANLTAAVETAHVPTVSLVLSRPTIIQVPCCIPDGEAAGEIVAAHLLDRGFSRFVFVAHLAGETNQCGFTRAIRAAGADLRTVFVTDLELQGEIPPVNFSTGLLHDSVSGKRRAWVRRFFSQCDKPVGVYSMSTTWTTSIIEGCHDAHILVPEQVAVVSQADTIEEGIGLPVPLTTIVPDYEEQGYQAARLLDQMMRGEPVSADKIITIPPKALVPRESTLCHITDNPRMTRAVTFVMRNLHDPGLCVKQVQRAAKMSCGTFYRDFRGHFKMTIAKFIEHRRMKEALHLLGTTDATASAIAVQCGFGDLPRFRDTLKRTTGMGPAEWREEHVGEKVQKFESAKVRGCEDEKGVTASRKGERASVRQCVGTSVTSRGRKQGGSDCRVANPPAPVARHGRLVTPRVSEPKRR